ncbi:MAG: lasso peptide biosynthesis B2 protein [Vicinamibacterales bacterium]
MRHWQQFQALDAPDRWLTIEAFMLMAMIQVGFRVLSYATMRGALDKVKGIRGDSGRSQFRIGWAVNAAGRRLPGRTCLIEALAADVMLGRRGYSPRVRFGIRKTRGDVGAPETHAWVECGGTIVTGELPMMDDYRLLY